MQDLKVGLSPLKRSGSDSVCVHNGFQEQYESLRDNLRQKCIEYAEIFEPDEILVTGHSMGGALATLCAIDFEISKFTNCSKMPKTLRVVTLGKRKKFLLQFSKVISFCYHYWDPHKKVLLKSEKKISINFLKKLSHYAIGLFLNMIRFENYRRPYRVSNINMWEKKFFC